MGQDDRDLLSQVVIAIALALVLLGTIFFQLLLRSKRRYNRLRAVPRRTRLEAQQIYDKERKGDPRLTIVRNSAGVLTNRITKPIQYHRYIPAVSAHDATKHAREMLAKMRQMVPASAVSATHGGSVRHMTMRDLLRAVSSAVDQRLVDQFLEVYERVLFDSRCTVPPDTHEATIISSGGAAPMPVVQLTAGSDAELFKPSGDSASSTYNSSSGATRRGHASRSHTKSNSDLITVDGNTPVNSLNSVVPPKPGDSGHTRRGKRNAGAELANSPFVAFDDKGTSGAVPSPVGAQDRPIALRQVVEADLTLMQNLFNRIVASL